MHGGLAGWQTEGQELADGTVISVRDANFCWMDEETAACKCAATELPFLQLSPRAKKRERESEREREKMREIEKEN